MLLLAQAFTVGIDAAILRMHLAHHVVQGALLLGRQFGRRDLLCSGATVALRDSAIASALRPSSDQSG